MIETKTVIKDKVVKVYRDGKYTGMVSPVRWSTPELGYIAFINGNLLGVADSLEATVKLFEDDPE